MSIGIDRPRMRHGKDVEVELDAKEAAEYPLAQATSMFIETVAAAADVGDEFYHTVIELKTQVSILVYTSLRGSHIIW